MTVPKKYNHADYMHKSSEANPTTKGDLYRYFENDWQVVEAMVDSLLWQPSTAYAVGAVVHHPDMPAGYVARCTTAGTSSASDPAWQAGETADGTVKWSVEKPALASDLSAETSAREKAVQDEHDARTKYDIKRNTAYKVGDVLTSPYLPPGCIIVVTTAGTTGESEPDWDNIKENMGG